MVSILFAITIDAEADHQPTREWRRSSPLAFHSIGVGIAERLVPLFARFRARPTYLLTYEVLESREAVGALASLKDCELGAHLHGECAPPQNVDGAGIVPRDLQCLYPRDLERAKIAALVDKFKSVFGYAPRSFRAGSYGADGETMALLNELGFCVDTSVTPHMCWTHPQGILDFTRAPDQPYHPSPDDICDAGTSAVLEVPVSISLFRSRTLIRWRPFWLRPSTATAEEMMRVIDDYCARYRHADQLALNMMFHSMEVVAGTSPYARTEQDAREVLRRIEETLAYAQSRGAEFLTLSELAERWQEEKRVVS
jgi:hypothetical protein